MTPIYGARLTDHTPPNGAFYAVAGAPLDDPGTMLRPCGDPQHLMRRAPAGATIILTGEFHTGLVQQWRRPVTIQPAPGERAILIGSEPATQWTREADWWWHRCPTFDHTPNGDILNPARPWASWPEQVWMDGEPLEMVLPGSALENGQFTMSGGYLWIGEDPTEHDMLIAVRGSAFAGSLDMETGVHPPVILRGVEAWHFATTSDERAAIKVYGDSHLEDVTVVDCSATGISVMRSQGATVNNCTVDGAGQLGVHGFLADNLELGWNRIDGGNRKGFASIGEAGAVKLFRSTGARAHHNRVTACDGHGLWWDGDSDDGAFWRNHVTDCETGVFYELSANGRIVGNLAEDCRVGVLLSGSRDTEVTHNTARGCDRGVYDQPDRRRSDERATNFIRANSGDTPAPPTLAAAALLELSIAETAEPSAGWYGPEYLPPEPDPPESPMPYDITLIEGAHVALGTEVIAITAEVRRLEAIIAADDDDAVIADLQARLTAREIQVWNLTVLRDQQIATIASQQTTIAAQAATISAQQTTIQEQADTILDLDAAVADLSAQLAARTAERDQALADLAACQQNCPPPEPVPSVIIGGSDKLGYPDLKTRLDGVLPGSFTHFIAGPRFTAAEEAKMAVYVADGVIPSLSFAVGTNADTDYNISRLIARGWHELAGGYSIGNEPTQKATEPEVWRAANMYAAAELAELAPSWTLVLGPFQRVDIHASQADARFIGNWIGPDTTWATTAPNVALGVNVYDKHKTNGQSFETLVTVAPGPGPYSVESYARELGLRIWVREANAPEAQTGEWQRPAGWKPQWYEEMWPYVSGEVELYHLVAIFNGDGPGEPPEGWEAWTTPESLAAYRAIIEASQS